MKIVFAALSLIWAAVSADAHQFSANDLTRRIVERRAVEAVIWGMPAVNYDLMLQEMLRLGGKANQLTPNPDAIYLMLFINTKDVGPVVIEIPPARPCFSSPKLGQPLGINDSPKRNAMQYPACRRRAIWSKKIAPLVRGQV